MKVKLKQALQKRVLVQ